MPEFSGALINLFNAKREAPDQGGLLSGKDPTAVNTSDPLRLWVIQLGIIIATASLLSLVLRKIRQPKVIAEVLGGILLGPTAFGRIPGFTEHIFPDASRPYLSLTANIGLCLFLFLVGLEIDSTVIKRNARLSVTVALAGMILPFSIGSGLSVALYKQFIDQSIQFTHFMLFTGVAFSITAFPVLCRILTELKLLDTTVGIVVLSAGVGNDIIGWTLLALSVALVNAGSGLTALYILLLAVGWTLFLLFVVRYGLLWLARKSGSIESGPTVLFMTVTILILFASSFFTDVIGVHAIFGAFVTGIIVPREGNLAIALTEKLEDMVAIIFLPLYFTLSGLSTDLGLLNDGITWAYTIAIIGTAFIGKFSGCAISARYVAGFNWRESGAIGALMSCKGLVELIVLNVGLSAGILTPRVFSMFVLEALTLTFMTTPLVTRFYPPHVRRRISAVGGTFGSVPDGSSKIDNRRIGQQSVDSDVKRRFTLVLDKLEHLPGAMAITQLLKPSFPNIRPQRSSAESRTSTSAISLLRPPSLSIEALRLIELSDRTSAVMKSSVAESLLRTDPLLAVFKMFGQLNALPIRPALAIVPYDDLTHCVVEHAENHDSDMIMLTWLPPSVTPPPPPPTGTASGFHTPAIITSPSVNAPPEVGLGLASPSQPVTPKAVISHNPFDLLFKTGASNIGSTDNKPSSSIHSHFVRTVFSRARTDVALYIDQSGEEVVGLEGTGNGNQHLFLPFFGGPDDRLALEFVVQMCENEKVTASVLRVVKREVEVSSPVLNAVPLAHLVEPKSPAGIMGFNAEEANAMTIATIASAVTGLQDTAYGQLDTAMRMQSETADNIIWQRYTSPSAELQDLPSLSRITFKELATPVPLRASIQEAEECRKKPGGGGGAHVRLVIVVGRGRRLAVENHAKELKDVMGEYGSVGMEVKKTVGDVGTAFVVGRCGEGVVVLQEAVGEF